MSDWSSYQLQDFIPFTADIYFRLLERMGETFWPLHLPALGLGAAALFLALKNRTRLACLLLAPPWAFVGLAFFERYGELNWAGHHIGLAFITQAIILALFAVTGWGAASPSRHKNLPALTGVLIAAFGLIGWPVISTLAGHSWYGVETFGIHPDPTAIATLGLAPITLRGVAMWIAALIPAFWIILSGLTLLVLGAPWAFALFTILAAGLVGLAWKSAAGGPD